MSDAVAVKSLTSEQIARLLYEHGEAPSMSVARRLIAQGFVTEAAVERALIAERKGLAVK